MNIKELAYEHAWRYFELHAQQRMTVFNFYLALSGLISAGIGLCLQQGGNFIYLSSLLSFFLLFISFIFWKLDERVSLLLKQSEIALTEIEKEMHVSASKLFTIDRSNKMLSKGLLSTWTYGRCLRISFFVVGNCSLLMMFIPFALSLKK